MNIEDCVSNRGKGTMLEPIRLAIILCRLIVSEPKWPVVAVSTWDVFPSVMSWSPTIVVLSWGRSGLNERCDAVEQDRADSERQVRDPRRHLEKVSGGSTKRKWKIAGKRWVLKRAGLVGLLHTKVKKLVPVAVLHHQNAV